MIAFLWLFPLTTLAFWYSRINRRDQNWKKRWEERHGSSMTTLRGAKQRTLHALTAVRTVMFAIFFIGLGATIEPAISLMKGLRDHRVLLTDALIAVNVVLLAALIILVVAVELAKYELRQIERLASGEHG